MAVKLGYKNVYRDPYGYPDWLAKGYPIESKPAGLSEGTEPTKTPGPLYGWAMLWTLLGIFAGGIALNLTPCVYPMIPITVSYFGGRSGQGQGRLVLHGLLYMVGLALTNSILGVIASLTGGLMGAMLQNPIVLIIVAGILVFFASSLFGLWELRLPEGLNRMASKSYTGYLGTLFMGITLGLVAAPCIGPFVLGLLTWVASMASPWLGFLIFFTLSLGLGLPLFILALFSGKIEKLPRSGEWMLWIRKLMGWVLAGMAAYFMRPLLPEVVVIFLLALVALIAGFHLGWLDKSQAGFKAFVWMKAVAGIAGLALAALILGTWLIRGPGVSWDPYSETLLAEAAQSRKPIIIDFYATWCTPCRELDEVTFHHPEVVKRGNRDFVMIKVDVTKAGNPLNERLLKQYAIKGVPTVLFLDPAGKERLDLRLVDFIPPEPFLKKMESVRRK
ncbi:MAG TPA: cytochrome c biogenesis protein CcdA [Thermodesulfobacteriota bacterium]|nr:cytochrome c biogenesis protein CcdA [Thermodesulfobacteriota bacterium]